MTDQREIVIRQIIEVEAALAEKTQALLNADPAMKPTLHAGIDKAKDLLLDLRAELEDLEDDVDAEGWPSQPVEEVPRSIECPMCAEKIKARAKICRFCHYDLVEERHPSHSTNRAGEGRRRVSSRGRVPAPRGRHSSWATAEKDGTLVLILGVMGIFSFGICAILALAIGHGERFDRNGKLGMNLARFTVGLWVLLACLVFTGGLF